MYLVVALIFILFGVGRISYIFGFLAHRLFFSLTVTFYKIVFNPHSIAYHVGLRPL